MDLNKFGKRAFNNAMQRAKISDEKNLETLHGQTCGSLDEEIRECVIASETEKSEHLSDYTQIAEELADVAIVAFTEMYRRGIDIERVLHEKMKFNETRRY